VINSRSGSSSAPAGYRFPREVIAVAVRWYLRYGLSHRDVEKLLAERGIEVDHLTVYRWVQTVTPEFIDAAPPARHATGNRWLWMRPTSRSPAAGPTSTERSISAARLSTSSSRAAGMRPRHGCSSPARCRSNDPPVEVTTDRAPAYPRVIDEYIPSARHVVDRYANNPIEADHARLKAGLRPMRGLKRLASSRTIATGHAFVQNLRRGHYELTVDLLVRDRVRVAARLGERWSLATTTPHHKFGALKRHPALCEIAKPNVAASKCR
jgi:transposase, IS6 family